MPHRLAVCLLAAFLASADRVYGDGPMDNIPDKVRPIPPAGIALDEGDRAALQKEVDELGKQIAELPAKLRGKPALLELLPDVEVLHKAVGWALAYQEMYTRGEVAGARKLLALGRERARQLTEGQPGWPAATGLVVRGYRSRIDGSVQPYGLVVPASYRPAGAHRHRLDVWLHGRGERLTELSFLSDRLRSPGAFVPRDAFVLHPYGRYCNAFKFAGEIDVFEALGHARRHYPIDEDRLVMRGFSMGGAGCWQFAVHYPDRWAAAAPGAGFSETPEFLKVFQKEELKPSAYEQALWRLYDCPGYAVNLFNLPTVAYSGEKDRQKQAADVMAEALSREGIDLVHLIGPNTGHSYHPVTRAEIDRRIDRLAGRGRDRVPRHVRFATYTLRYNRSFWVQVDGIERHFGERATVDAMLNGEGTEVHATTGRVTALTLTFGPGDCPLPFALRPSVVLDGTRLTGLPAVRSDRSWSASFRRAAAGGWELRAGDEKGLRKRHGLQGPIDDAFLDSFLVVRPTGKPMHDRTAAWVKAEQAHALEHWRKQFRGDARVKDDVAVTDEDAAAHHLVLWGDPSSNRYLAKLAERLPVRWDEKEVRLGKESFAAEHHVPVLIYPNPLNPRRYVVINSGFTYREYDYLNNARQVPKLPDFAVLDVRTPPSSRWPGKVVRQGFFDETWKLP